MVRNTVQCSVLHKVYVKESWWGTKYSRGTDLFKCVHSYYTVQRATHLLYYYDYYLQPKLQGIQNNANEICGCIFTLSNLFVVEYTYILHRQ